MTRHVKWLSRTLGVLVIVALGAMILYVVILPFWVERRLIGALQDFGLPGTAVELRSVGLHRTQLANLCIGDGQPFIGVLSVTYDATGLWFGRVRVI